MQVKIKGAVIHARRSFVEKHFGPDAWQRVFAALSEEDRQVLAGCTEVGWYSFAFGDRLDSAIVHVLGEDSPQVFEEIGAASARENLTTVHHAFLKPGDPQAFMARAPNVYKFYYDTGYRTYEPTGPCSGVLCTHEADTFSRTDCLTVVGWYRQGLELCGARNVQIVEETCRAEGGPVCRYRLSWSMGSPGEQARSR